MGCGASSAQEENAEERYRYVRKRRGTQSLPPDLINSEPPANGKPKKNLEGIPIVSLVQQPGEYVMTKTRLMSKAAGQARFHNLARGHHTIARAPPQAGTPTAKAFIVLDFAQPFVVNMSEEEEHYLKTMTVKKLQKVGAITYQGSFSVAYTDDDPVDTAFPVACLSPRSTKRKMIYDRQVEMQAVEEAVGHLVLKLVAPRVALPSFNGATLRPLGAFESAVVGLAVTPSERLVTVSTSRARHSGIDGLDRLSRRSALELSTVAMRVIDVYTGLEAQPFRDSRILESRDAGRAPTHLGYFNDEQVLTSLGANGVELWDTVKRVKHRQLSTGRHFDPIERHDVVKVSTCGRMIATGGTLQGIGAVALFREARQFLNFLDHLVPVSAIDWSPCSEWLASGDTSGEILVWSSRSGAWRARVRAHTDPVVSLIFLTPTTLISVSGRAIRCWRVSTQSCYGEASRYQPIAVLRSTEAGLDLQWEITPGATAPRWVDIHAAPEGATLWESQSARSGRSGMVTPRAPPDSARSAKSARSHCTSCTPTGNSVAEMTSNDYGDSCTPRTLLPPCVFTSATLTPCALIAVTHNTRDVLILDPAAGFPITSVRTAGIPTAVAAGRAMCAIGDALGNVYALDIDASHSLPGPSNPIVTTSTPRAPDSPRPGTPRGSVC